MRARHLLPISYRPASGGIQEDPTHGVARIQRSSIRPRHACSTQGMLDRAAGMVTLGSRL